MMKSGLSQNEKLKALRIVIDNVDFDTLNEILRKVVPFKKKLKEFVDAEIEPPSAYDVADLMEKIEEPLNFYAFQAYCTQKDYKENKNVRVGRYWDPLTSLRVVTRHVGQLRPIMEAKLKNTLS